jgi:hypothetical protein
MTENKKIKTDYAELDKILGELGIIEYIKYGEHLPTEWHELKTLRIEDGVQALSPISVDDLVKVYEKVKSTLCNNVTCNGRENGIQLRQAKKLIEEFLDINEYMCIDDEKTISEIISKAHSLLGDN